MNGITLGNDTARIVVRPDLGAGLASYDVKFGPDWQPIFRPALDAKHPFDLSNILMVPFSGRVSGGGFSSDGVFHPIEPNLSGEKLPIHGSGFTATWQIDRQTETGIVLSLMASRIGPFLFDAEASYELRGATLVMRLQVVNRATIRLPYGAGFHPWFVRDRETLLAAAADTVWLEGDNYAPGRSAPISSQPEMDFSTARVLPEGWLLHWADGWTGKALLEWPQRHMAVEITASPGLDRYVIYSPETAADFVCFEPVSHAADGYNLPGGAEQNGLRILAPGETLDVWAEYRPIIR